MATIKAYTDLQQSKKLAEILPLESADMWWLYVTAQGKYIAMMHEEPNPHYLARMESYGLKDASIRCWSIAALLEILSKVQHPTLMVNAHGKWICDMYNIFSEPTAGDNPVDACYEMVLQLHKLKRL